MPKLTVIGGPYGVGKTSAMLRALGPDIVRGKFVDPQRHFDNKRNYYAIETYKGEKTRDFVERSFTNAFSERFDQLKEHKSLTTICSLGDIEDIDLLDAAQRHGFEIRLFFFGVDNWESCVDHIRSTPNHWLSQLTPKEIYGNYYRALAMLPGAIIKADSGAIFDNSDRENPKPLLGIENGRIKIVDENLPKWIIEPLSRCL